MNAFIEVTVIDQTEDSEEGLLIISGTVYVTGGLKNWFTAKMLERFAEARCDPIAQAVFEHPPTWKYTAKGCHITPSSKDDRLTGDLYNFTAKYRRTRS